MRLLGYSERGLVNALCYDCVHDQHGSALLAGMLQAAWFPLLEGNPLFADICHATLLVEQSLSQFGDCDLIILCDTTGGTKFVIFCEFKRGVQWLMNGEWNGFTVRIENKIREQLTSNLFCQLYFKQRFGSALAGITGEDLGEGLEFDEPLNIASGDGRRRIGTNQTVLRAVEMIRPYVKESYFLMVTPQPMNQNECRDFAQTTTNWQNHLRGWSTYRWGHLSLNAIHEFCGGRPDTFHHTLDVFEYNLGQLYQGHQRLGRAALPPEIL